MVYAVKLGRINDALQFNVIFADVAELVYAHV
jgi:hypothetical protein